MYKDVGNLVHTGMGNLIDEGTGEPPAKIYDLQWRHGVNGLPASRQEIRDTWKLVKDDTSLSVTNGGFQYAKLPGNDLRLTQESYDKIINDQLNLNIAILKSYFPSIDMWPADAQLAILGIAWGRGPHFSKLYPAFTKAVNGLLPNFVDASNESSWHGIATLRELGQKTLFLNAAQALRKNLSTSRLYWPGWDRVQQSGIKDPVALSENIMGSSGGSSSNVPGLPSSGFTGREKPNLGRLAIIGAGALGLYKAIEHRHMIKETVSGLFGKKPEEPKPESVAASPKEPAPAPAQNVVSGGQESK